MDDTTKTPPTERGGVCEVKQLKRTHQGGKFVVTDSGLETDDSKDKYRSYALVSTENFDEKGKPTDLTLAINSKHILAALAAIVKYYPAHDRQFNQPIEIRSPFALLYHHRKELADHAVKSTDDAAVHLSLLLAYLEEQPWAEATQLIQRETPVITFELLWYIFKPGDLIYTKVNGHACLYWLIRTSLHKRGFPMQQNVLVLDCAYHFHDGKDPGRAATKLEISQALEFSGNGPEKVQGLSVFPLKFHGDPDNVRIRLRERGKRYEELAVNQGSVHRYDGLCMRLKMPPGTSYYTSGSDFMGVWLPQTATGRVIHDYRTFMEDHPAHGIKICNWSREKGKIVDGPEDPTILYPPFVYGYYLDMRCWCQFAFEELKPAVWKQSEFESVLLPENYSQTIRPLVEHHKYARDARDETGLKGKGLVFVLQGPPGTGKTKTAEAIAESTKKPLLLFPAGELGSTLSDIQMELKRLVRYATTWSAILLIDEADVFLESREKGGQISLERNALVAIFLRQLEYFQGIIFLTSNRAPMFDPAVLSRINILLHYPFPDKQTRKKLWEQKLMPMQSRIPPECDLEGGLGRATEILSGDYEMNGREISNTVNTAQTIARHNLRPLELPDLVMVAEIWKDGQPRAKAGPPGLIDKRQVPPLIKSFSTLITAIQRIGIPFWVLRMVGLAVLGALLQRSFSRLLKGRISWLSRRRRG